MRKLALVLGSVVALLMLTAVANWAKISMNDGTVAAPGLSFLSDVNTGIYRTVADTINFGGGGVAAATLTPGTLALKKTTTTNSLTSDSSATATTTGVAAITMGATVNITDGDLVLNVENSANDNLFTVDEQGACTSLTTLNATTDVNLAGGDLTNSMTTQSFNVKSATADGTTTGAVGAITLKATADIGNSDLVLDVQPSTTTHLFTVDEAGLCTALTDVAAAGNNFMCTGTATCQLDSAANDGATSGTAAAFTLVPSVNVTDGDLILNVENSANDNLLTVTEQGAVTALTTVKGTTGVVIGSAAAITSTAVGFMPYALGAIAPGDCASTPNIALTGTALVGDPCMVGMAGYDNADAGSPMSVSCRVTSSTTAVVTVCAGLGTTTLVDAGYSVRAFSL
ncbi:MAG: hypothetical protein WC876_01900 [Candidatus Thermoplasmatota archaeon]|jgi:hypothetical protein